jgi:hypothetical protein
MTRHPVCAKDEKVVNTNVAALEINIINNSPVDIYIKDAKLKIRKDYHGLVDCSNPFWEDIYFFYYNDKGEKEWDGSGINYKATGLQLPTVVKSYTILSCLCLFHHFPDILSLKLNGKVVLNTAVGKLSKKVKFRKYDANYVSAEMKDVEIYLKNIKK